jgi:hypothetical protein
MANEETEPVKSGNDEQLQPNAAQSGPDFHRPGRKNAEPKKPRPHSGTAITARAEGAFRSKSGHRKSEPVNREAPRYWKTSDKEAFKALPAPTQDFILRQCCNLETMLGKKSEQLAAFHREYEPVAKLIEPFAGRLKELNLTPGATIQRYIDIERQLAGGDGVAVIRALVHGYKVAPDQVIEALRSKLPDTQVTPLPHLAQLNRQMPVDVTRQLDRPEGGAQRAAALRDFESQVEQFKTAQDTAGNPLHPHYADIEPEMAAMALAYRSRGQMIPPLKELYERAVWMNSALRRALVSAQQGTSKTTADASKPRTAARKPALSANAGESRQALTGQPFGRSLRDEIVAHLDSA